MNKNNNNKILLIQSLDLETAQKVSTCPGKTQPGENYIFSLYCAKAKQNMGEIKLLIIENVINRYAHSYN